MGRSRRVSDWICGQKVYSYYWQGSLFLDNVMAVRIEGALVDSSRRRWPFENRQTTTWTWKRIKKACRLRFRVLFRSIQLDRKLIMQGTTV